MTRMYFDVESVRVFLETNGYVATMRDPRVTKRKAVVERIDPWRHAPGLGRWGRPLGFKAMRAYLVTVSSPREVDEFVPISSFESADVWWKKATEFYAPVNAVMIPGGGRGPIWLLDVYYVHALQPRVVV